MKEAVVLYTGPGLGHLIPMAVLAKRFLNHGFSVTVVTFNHPLNPGKADQDVSRLSSANSTISFHVLPPVSLDDGYENLEPLTLMRAALAAQNVNLHKFLMDLSKTSFIQAVVLDLFCPLALDVASQLSIPAYFFTAFGASATAFFLHLLELDASSNLSLKDFGENPTNFPGLPPVLASDLPSFLLDRTSDSYKSFVKNLTSLVKSDGILMNTFASLEPKAISALREGLCVPSFNMPPVYSIGPLVTESQETETERHECLKWLDLQPKGTVVFLCFGSMGGFPPDQIKQIATGLENSGQRFLWVVNIAMDPKMMFYNSMSEFELDQILPEGFLNRTKDRGMVVISWAPQIQVLNHESVGGFVTHCGWNSILEAVTAGKPMLCWPLYAEQRLNKEILVNELRLGMTIEGYDRDMVEADEIEAKVRWLMEDEGGRLLKERSKAMKDKAAESFTEAGPSSQAFMQFLKDLER
ncbi:anthocyanidin 5,3-O-glucosyltransferase-like protein [Carex littledalei]|uniref:Glycosyltransferase n=1 Tax=Carex littledalei TaxID=544730 RepID=A0A833VBD6_9POAL|nr:anthocyanidin 5,3-O-glucosyltransferase-like protein [Carex littledalei]